MLPRISSAQACLALVFLSADLFACGGSGRPERDQVEAALERGIAAIERETFLQAGDLWMVQELQKFHPDPRLGAVIERWKQTYAGDPSLRLIDSTTEKIFLPKNPGRGLTRYSIYVISALGRPESRAIEFVRAFMSSDLQGYPLTHQFLATVWAEICDLALPDDLLARRPRLLERMAAEQAAETRFSDLFAERAFLLLLFDATAPRDAARWVQIVLDAQGADGAWVDDTQVPMLYDGQNGIATLYPGHTTPYAALDLAVYLERF